ncbi:hypothetical protein [Mucilaginibacter boryungensis]|uniref:Uncharacterized protein n=1 Tax=Mucilaginibacter boryungensis TaxID=768480 RepID=A0ABR9XDE0_9SPHI|nr:hypothetical protein [Mucilaginibacter boryungensis]MBE9665205.1 hypothetical protein [Mucilaginibacter boryungensis]
MKTDNKHYKFINSQTGNTIFYHQVGASLTGDELRAVLEKVKAQVATQNALPVSTIYWEEVKDTK